MTKNELIKLWIEEIKNNNKRLKDAEFKNNELIQNKNTIWLKTNINNENNYFYIKSLKGKIKWFNNSIYPLNEYGYNSTKDFI